MLERFLLTILAPISTYKFSRLVSIKFPYRISRENLIKDQSMFPLVIIFFILITFSLHYVLTLLGENNIDVGHSWELQG